MNEFHAYRLFTSGLQTSSFPYLKLKYCQWRAPRCGALSETLLQGHELRRLFVTCDIYLSQLPVSLNCATHVFTSSSGNVLCLLHSFVVVFVIPKVC